MKRSVMQQGQPLFQIGSFPPDSDPYEDIDPEYLQRINELAETYEIEYPDDPPRTDGPEQVAQVLPPPPAPTQGEYTPEIFPTWARTALDRGDWARTRTDVTTRGPQIGGQPGVNVVPQDMPLPDGVTPSQALDIHQAIVNGPNAANLSDVDVDVLRNAILLQWGRLIGAAQRTPVGGTTTAAGLIGARTLEESRRFSALMGLATMPQDMWPALEQVWRSAPISQGEGGTLDEFLSERKALLSTGRPEDTEKARQQAIQRANAILSQTPSTLPTRQRTKNQRVAEAAQAIGAAVIQPGASPTATARIVTGDDLTISPIDVLLGMRYNNMLLGPRGILVDYVSNTGQLFMKALSDLFLPETGGMDPRARATITAVEYAAVGKFFPLMMQRVSSVILNGVSDLQASQAGTPHSISGKLDRKMEDALADRDY